MDQKLSKEEQRRWDVAQHWAKVYDGLAKSDEKGHASLSWLFDEIVRLQKKAGEL